MTDMREKYAPFLSRISPGGHILDLGCGVGRNSIAVANYFSDTSCRVDCVDILPLAIQKLTEYGDKYQVSNSICGYISPIDSFYIEENTYDLVLAVSVLEHSDSEESLIKMFEKIKNGIRSEGIFCLIMNTDVHEYDPKTGMEIPAQFEVNLKTEKLLEILNETFGGWETIKTSVRNQQYDIPRKNCISELTTDVVTFVAKNNK